MRGLGHRPIRGRAGRRLVVVCMACMQPVNVTTMAGLLTALRSIRRRCLDLHPRVVPYGRLAGAMEHRHRRHALQGQGQRQHPQHEHAQAPHRVSLAQQA